MTEKLKRILVVDDDVDMLDQAKAILGAKGIEVFTADNADEGFQTFQEKKPDAIILDLMMEEYDSGFVLAHKMKRAMGDDKKPIFLATAVANVTGMKFDSTTEEEKEWIKTDAVLNKPFTADEVLAKIDAYYEKIGD
ncbi:MAG: response regulator [Ignavibacteriales bacterium]|nr:response regulator [Ignavibacteriales bacterium]